jgi:hypothetical protein
LKWLVVFEKLVQVLVFGCAYHRIADEWIELGVMERLREISRGGGGGGLLHHQGPLRGLGRRAGARWTAERGAPNADKAVDARGIPLAPSQPQPTATTYPLLAKTLDAVAETLGELPESTSIHLGIAATTTPRAPASGYESAL